MDKEARDGIKAGLVERLRSNRKWFRKRKLQMQWLWIVCSIVSLTLGFVTSILIALGWPEPSSPIGKAILVVFPAISSFCGTILIHFRLREYWELREMGRLSIDELLVEAHFLPVENEDLFMKKWYDIETKRITISRLQTSSFFMTLSEQKAKLPLESLVAKGDHAVSDSRISN